MTFLRRVIMRSRGGWGLGMLLLAGFLALGTLSAPAAAEAVRPKRIRVSQAGESMLFLPAYVAAVQGYFQEEGLEVTQVPKGAGRSEVQALIAREVHFAMADGISQLSAMQKGAKVLAVANIGDKLAVNLAIHRAAAEAAGITAQTPFAERLKAIKGLTFGATRPETIPWQVGQHIVKRAGYTPQKEVQIIAAGAGPLLLAELEQRKIDVLIETVPVPETAVERGHAIMLFDLARGEDPEIGEFLLESLLVRPEFARQEPDTVRRMVRALLKGSRFIAERSPEEIAAALQNTPLSKFPHGVLLAGVASLKGVFPPHGRMSQRALDVTQRFMREAGQLKRPFTLLEIYTPEFLP